MPLYSQALPPQESIVPEDYEWDEFPQWAWDLRRFEVVSVGTFPLAFFLGSLVYDFSIFAQNNFDPAYSLGSQRSSRDIAIITGTAAGLSLAVATTDLIITLVKRSKEDENREQRSLSRSDS
ncbi:MAG: hypothetical protein MI717_04450 [Spirochaetales bacterium]|nr:hypothetical protein [Spirochaetales bacterium]